MQSRTLLSAVSSKFAVGRESEARGEWAGAAVSLAQSAPPPAKCNTLQVQSALSSRRISSPAALLRSPTNVTRSVTSYQDTRGAEEVSRPYITIVRALTLKVFYYIHPFRFPVQLTRVSLLPLECGKPGFGVPTLSFNS